VVESLPRDLEGSLPTVEELEAEFGLGGGGGETIGEPRTLWRPTHAMPQLVAKRVACRIHSTHAHHDEPREKAKLMTKLRAKTMPYSEAAQLRTPEERAAYLDAWLVAVSDEPVGDPAAIARALGDIARAKGMSRVASEAGLSRESLYKALGENGNPSFATVLKVARAVGVRMRAEVG